MTLPVYLVAGAAGPGADFAFLAPMLARRRPMTALDLPRPADQDEPSDLDELADHALAALPTTPFALVGHARGAAVALAVASRSPLVERLVLIAGAPDHPPAPADVAAPTLLIASRHDTAAHPTALPAHAHRVLLDCGTAVLVERPAEVLRYVDAFLDGALLAPVKP